MKSNKILTVITTILIISIIAVLGILVYYLFGDTIQASLKIGADEQNEMLLNQVTINTETQNQIRNEQTGNQVIIEPILNQITTNVGSQTNENEGLVSSYYYSQLNETAKEIYDGLKTNKEKLVSGNYVVDYGTKFNTLLNSEGGEEKLNLAFQSAWNAFSYDNVDLFYIDITKQILTNEYHSLGGIRTYKISIGPGNNTNYFQSSFNSKQDVENANIYLENIKKQMIEQTSTDDEYTKIAKVHNWLIQFVSYEQSEDSRDYHTIYGALKNGKAVCEGYARAFKYLMDGVGVPCILVSGTGTNSRGETEEHAWNYVQINEKWYAIDVTWDDPIIIGGELNNELKYRYFLKGSEEFFKDHREDGKISENSITFKYPVLSNENYAR